MAYLLDTSILARLANAADPAFAIAYNAIVELHHRAEIVYVTPQNFIEFRNVATRPVALNGLGLSVAVAEGTAAGFETRFPLLPDTPDIFPAWKLVVHTSGAIGKQVHDARLIAVCHVHAITHLLTFNIRHFARFANTGPSVVIVDPATV
jgi:predicted nucleic acid-binding protein